MDLTSMRGYVRSYLDIDSEDCPDSLIDPMFDEAAVRIAEREPHWPWLRSSWTVDFAATTAASGSPVSATGDTVREILVVRPSASAVGQTHLSYIDHDTALMRYWGSATEPLYWSILGDQMYLWPTPTSDITVLVDGYREMNTSWTSGGSGASPDCPERFHNLFLDWALRGVYLQQDDPETAAIHDANFDKSLAAKIMDVMRAPAAPPLVMNGDVHRSTGYNPTYWDV